MDGNHGEIYYKIVLRLPSLEGDMPHQIIAV